MYCQDCNTGNSVDSKYCKECGAKINSGYRTMMLSIQDLPLHQSDEDVEKLTRLLDMAFWHNQAGNADAAIIACEAALAVNPHSTTAHSLLGTLFEKQGEDDKAIHHFESVLALNPDSQADAQKLEQLRRGVHVRAVAPPITHQWLPPAFLKLGPTLGKRFASLSATPLSANLLQIDPQRRPLFAAGGATALVLIAGLLFTRPWAQADAVKTYPVTSPAAPPAVSVSRSAFGTPAQTASVPPVVLMPGRANTNAPAYLPPALTTRDPFAGQVPAPEAASSAAPAGAGSPLWSLPPVSRPSASRPSASRRSRGMSLPPLRLAALPAAESGIPGGVAPAPVALPPGIEPSVLAAPAVAPVPRHTVVVGNFNSSPAPSAAPYSSDLSSHIRITVHQSHDGDTASAGSNAAPSLSAGGSGSDASGDVYQQRALSLQESGAYSQARQAYQSAIRSYQTQIAAGRDVETAQRGLAACQTGLQICQQSQP